MLSPTEPSFFRVELSFTAKKQRKIFMELRAGRIFSFLLKRLMRRFVAMRARYPISPFACRLLPCPVANVSFVGVVVQTIHASARAALLLGLWLCLLSFVSTAQTRHIPALDLYPKIGGLDPAVKLSQCVSAVWQAHQGLPQNSAYALHQTRDGYLWIGTEEGAARFDGVRFKVFDKETFPALTVAYTISFYERRDGSFWIGTRGGGLVKLEKNGDYTLFDSSKGLNAAEIWTMLEDRAGTFWIGTENGLFAYRNNRFLHFQSRHGLPHSTVYRLHEDKFGALYVGTQRGLCRLSVAASAIAPLFETLQDGASAVPRAARYFEPEALFTDTTDVRAILHDSKGALHVGARSGLWTRFATAKGGERWRLLAAKDGLPGDYVYDILEDRAGSLWLAFFDNGIARLVGAHGDKPRIERYETADGLVNENTLSLLEDREGSIWIGTYGGGIQRLIKGSCLTLTTREGLAENVVRSFAEDSSSALWVATNGKGVNVLKSGAAKPALIDKTRTKILADDQIRGMFIDHDGSVWVGIVGAGAQHYQNGKWRLYTVSDGLPSNDVYAITRDKAGALWFSTSERGIARLENGRFTRYGKAEGLANESVYALLADVRGGLWVGTFGGGAQYFAGGRWRTYNRANGLFGNNTLCFYQSPDSAVWVGGVGGISRIKNGVAKTLTKKEGLFDESAFSIVADDMGCLWASCNRGVYSFRKSEADSVLDGYKKALVCRSFGIADGMRSPECNGGAQPSGLKTKDGRVWFATIEGAVVFDPRHLERNVLPPPVIIEQVLSDTLLLRLSDGEEIPPSSRSQMQFHYTATSLVSADRTRFRYMLEGFDRDWTDAGERRVAYYTNLPRGKNYRFRVQACNQDGVWNTVGAAYRFTLQPYFYETWRFYLLCAVVSFVLIAGAYRLRVRQIRVQAARLEALVQERTKKLQQSNEELAIANAEVQRQIILSDMQAREIEIANAQLQETNQRLRQLDDEKNEFLGIAAHDLKNPLSSIIMTISMMQRYDEKLSHAERRSYLQRIETTAERMLRIVTDLLNVNAIESGEMKLHLEPVNIAEIAAEAAQHYQMIAQRKDIRFISEFPDSVLPVMADKERLWEVMENLLSNAVKFSPPSTRVFVRVYAIQSPATTPSETSSTALNGTSSLTKVRFEVQDEGPGVSEEDRARLFHKFARLSAQPTGGEHSTGLGLSIVKKMVEAMGGSVWCESPKGEGARFVVELPFAPDNAKKNEGA
jgi:signal transduction histidine kinase/ligand-binding sensor domain-containing protein